MRNIHWIFVAAALWTANAQAATPLFTPGLAKSLAVEAAPSRSVSQPVTLNGQALAKLARGAELELALPDGTRHAFILDQVTEHGQGIRSFVAYLRDGDLRRKSRAVLTTGPDGTFGFVQTPAGEFRVVPGRGHDWLVDMKAESKHHLPVDLAGDTRAVPRAQKPTLVPSSRLAQAEYADPIAGTTTPDSTKSMPAPSSVYVDVLFTYTRGYAAQLPGSQLQTRIAQLITTANTAYADSGVGIVLRSAGTLMVDYADDVPDSQALSDVTYGRVPALQSVASMRDQMGADLVTLLRGSADGYSGTGIAWLPPHAVTADDAPLMYSVVTGCTQACEWLWVHEVGHNMGNAHDRATIAWEVSALKQPESHGSFDYSYGYYTCDGAIDNRALSCPAFGGGCTSSEPQCAAPNASRNFSDIMGYFHYSTRAMVFSNPAVQCAGSDLPCGLADGSMDGTRPASANTALSMNNNRVALSALRSAGPARAQASAATATTLASNANPARAGTSVTVVARVAVQGNGAVVSEGTARFLANGAALAGCEAVPVSAGEARCAPQLPSGTYTVTADYSGSANYPASSGAFTQAIVALPALARGAPRRVDFNRDGTADLAWNGPGGAKGLWLVSGGAPSSAALISAPPGAVLRALADFDGDGADDALWRGADGTYWISLIDGTSLRSTVKILDATDGWEVVAVGDFNGDGRADLLWNSADGRWGTWLMNGASAQGFGSVAAPRDATAVLVGDLDGDGRADLVWQFSDGSVAASLMSGGNTGPFTTLMSGGSGFTPAAIGDLDGDGRADVLLAHADGRMTGWRMNGAAIAQTASLLGAGTGWKLARLADLDGDGRADLLWCYPADGTLGAWLMNGLAVKAYGAIDGTAGGGYTVAATGDFDGDGRADLLVRKASGEQSIWTMNGLARKSAQVVLQGGTGWEVAP